jgi:hypothetical protein
MATDDSDYDPMAHLALLESDCGHCDPLSLLGKVMWSESKNAGSKSSGSTTASSYKSDGSKSAGPKTPAQISDLSSLLRGRGGGKIIEN